MLKKYFNIEKLFVLVSTMVLINLVLPLNLNSISIYLVMLFCMVLLFKRKTKINLNLFIVLCVVYFLLNSIHCFTDSNTSNSFLEILRKSSFVLLPLLWLNTAKDFKQKNQQKILLNFSYLLTLIAIYLLLFAAYRYVYIHDFNVFLYHEFSSVIGLSAIYTSLLYSFSLSILFENYLKKPSKLLIILILFTTIIILLLSSKIYVGILLFIYLFYIFKLKKSAKIVVLALVCFLILPFLFNGNSIVKRFSDIKFDNIFTLNQKISQATEFDGFSLRKELVSIGIKMSSENLNTLFYGKGPGDTQEALNIEIENKGFYIGDKANDLGFINYNFHNQYIQTLVEIGVFGLASLIILLLVLIRIGVQQQNNLLIVFNFIFAIAFLTESYLNRQVGIVSFVAFNSVLLFSLPKDNYFPVHQFSKRAFDIVVSFLVIVFFLSWFLPIFLIFVIFETKANPIFKQKRAGLKTKPFTCYKLRTMMVNTTENETAAIVGDSRITKYGLFLRKYAIDELPQFFNVLIGDMSLVGPRPLMLKEEQEYGKLIYGFSNRLNIKPGITGLAQANGYKGYVDNLSDIAIRYKLDILYAKKQSFFLDIRIMIQTIIYLLKNNSENRR